MRTRVEVATFGKAMRVSSVTGSGTTDVARPAQQPSTGRMRDDGAWLTLEDAGFNAQPPASRYAVTLDAALTSVDGQTLGYTWASEVDNWHRSAFTSFGDGHGVWETSGGSTAAVLRAQLPERHAVGRSGRRPTS